MEVIFDNTKQHPSCPHGPCLMFERYNTAGIKTGKKFFACSAYRHRSLCDFFQWVEDKPSAEIEKFRRDKIEKKKPPFAHKEYIKRLKVFNNLPLTERRYCKTCSLLILPEESHVKHEIIDVIKEECLQPTILLNTLQNKKAEAYFFSEKTVTFIVTLLKDLGFTKLVLIGTPKVHEFLAKKSSDIPGLSSFLMDVDYRYMQFYDQKQFAHYNLFNNHFFGGESSKKKFFKFLTEGSEEKTVILLDPPFGGLIDAISHTLKKMNKLWQEINQKTTEEMVPLLWFFPYFFEERILQNIPELIMMDYKVEYENHKKYGMNLTSKGSPVRIFTNIKPSSFILPENEGYRFCDKCQRYVSKENLHCLKCGKCPTKYGPTYKHCNLCCRCVKSTHNHCDLCNQCSLFCTCPEISSCHCKCRHSEKDKKTSNTCHKCFGIGHRKRSCPFALKSFVKIEIPVDVTNNILVTEYIMIFYMLYLSYIYFAYFLI
ncbi:rRNA N6-adenosine-methyltransferase ZCCHC4-like isoform X2 [Stegodyphus dumicola]|uniref:rRNA N6-adenosine-methyltransferase ZCCHC4-like isoform X2 n=1 Tax=Stegodyphus dumicola TaxID=202533 RepID=UPI0015AE34B2|nr:rRNA N6-adenosine-methyltransferase ZCCHC4-like isoform X2 [Stegodyphus dumicola]